MKRKREEFNKTVYNTCNYNKTNMYFRMLAYIFQNCKLPLFRVGKKYFPIYAELSPIPMNKF